jgi:hypothetical protein
MTIKGIDQVVALAGDEKREDNIDDWWSGDRMSQAVTLESSRQVKGSISLIPSGNILSQWLALYITSARIPVGY